MERRIRTRIDIASPGGEIGEASCGPPPRQAAVSRHLHQTFGYHQLKLTQRLAVREESVHGDRSNTHHLHVRAFMSRPVHMISPWKNMAEVTRLMVKHDIGRLPVVGDGQLVDIITRSDAMDHVYGLCLLDGHLDPAGIRN